MTSASKWNVGDLVVAARDGFSGFPGKVHKGILYRVTWVSPKYPHVCVERVSTGESACVAGCPFERTRGSGCYKASEFVAPDWRTLPSNGNKLVVDGRSPVVGSWVRWRGDPFATAPSDHVMLSHGGLHRIDTIKLGNGGESNGGIGVDPKYPTHFFHHRFDWCANAEPELETGTKVSLNPLAVERDSLRDSLNKKKEEFERISARVTDLETDNEHLERERDEFRRLRDLYLHERDKLVTERDALKNKLTDLRTERDQLQGRNDYLNRRVGELETKNHALRATTPASKTSGGKEWVYDTEEVTTHPKKENDNVSVISNVPQPPTQRVVEPMFNVGDEAVVLDRQCLSHGKRLKVEKVHRFENSEMSTPNYTLSNGFTYYGHQLGRSDEATSVVSGRGVIFVPPGKSVATIDGITITNGATRSFSVKISGVHEKTPFDWAPVKAGARRVGRFGVKALPWALAVGLAVWSAAEKGGLVRDVFKKTAPTVQRLY